MTLTGFSVVIAGGGTGGHVFPMIAVGDAVRAIAPDARVTYVGTARGIEARVVPERGDVLELLEVLPLRGAGLRGFAKGALRAARTLPEARALVRRLAPDVVLSAGGYASGPVSLAARSLGVPLAILEPNAAMGLSNRLLAPLAKRAFVAFPEAERAFAASVVTRTGVPLRAAFAPVAYPAAAASEALRVLVLGGSQGAKALNETVPDAIAELAAGGLALGVVHQAGRAHAEALETRYAKARAHANVTARVTPFIDDMASELARAHVIVSRSGAGATAEICAVGRPSVLVPYPFAADDHQRKNAESLEQAGAAVCVRQEHATAERIARELGALAQDPERRARMAEAAAARGVPDAAAQVARELLAMARASRLRTKRPKLDPGAAPAALDPAVKGQR